MANNFGYYDNVAGVNYNTPNFYNPNYYNRNPYYPQTNWTNLVAGAGLGYLLGFGPLVGLGLGAILSNTGGENTNVININTGRRGYYNGNF
ncbi:hypothetical protein NBE98_11980 [Clostridium swellfunianum]|uniref:hypothetical protein n=1 Tax=Clostridium swellfunianum TaxID=1367462 RepID=UPI00202F3135|nr:hypothetical protein [Clostridium swellfunianum]MCM0649094.1 hypothetical protein [Clostridium swellfunianum]